MARPGETWDRRFNGPIHTFFGLSYANYLVLPRSILQDAPTEWQDKFVRVMDELFDVAEWDSPDYTVTARGEGGRFGPDPFSSYRHPQEGLVQWKR